VIESFGATSLTQVGNNYFLYANGTTTGPELKYQSAPVTTGQFGAGWTLIGGEQTSGGYEVAWKDGSTGQFTTWSTDSDGNYLANAIGVVSGTDPSLEALEPSFHQNLNGDGVIGSAEAGNFALSSAGGGTLVEVGGVAVQSENSTQAGTIEPTVGGDLSLLINYMAGSISNSDRGYATAQICNAASVVPEQSLAAAVQPAY